MSPTDIRGDEGSFSIPIQFRVNEVAQNRENDTTVGDNNITVSVPINAMARVAVEMWVKHWYYVNTLFSIYSPQRTINYLGNFTDISDNSQISPDFPRDIVQYTVRNMGPSTIFNTSLNILLPFIVPNQQDRYYLYPYNITVCLVDYVHILL